MTRGSDVRPVRRVLTSHTTGRSEDYVVELRQTLILIRPKGTRIGGKAEVAVPVGAIYQRAIISRMVDEKRTKRKGPFRVKRGALA